MATTNKRLAARRILSVLFTGAGIAHFANASFFASLVPESLARYRSEINHQARRHC